ncbi:hypothetical protein IMZ48_34585 [Candidatus Bathyarchaeota archaeon]|nr:hypothetical protein [Candidatus Bathyarchaeota archaeon]
MRIPYVEHRLATLESLKKAQALSPSNLEHISITLENYFVEMEVCNMIELYINWARNWNSIVKVELTEYVELVCNQAPHKPNRG